MMQHDKFEGVEIGISELRFDDRMRRIRRELLHAASLRTADDSPWFAVRVMTGREMAVEKVLSEANVEALVPMRRGPEYRRRHRVIPAQDLPVLSGYVLLRCHYSAEAMAGICGVEHVLDVVGGMLSPWRISSKIVSLFKAMAVSGAYDFDKPVGLFKKGDKVKFGGGPFEGLKGEIVSCRSDAKGDAVVEVEILGRMTPMLIPLAILEKV